MDRPNFVLYKDIDRHRQRRPKLETRRHSDLLTLYKQDCVWSQLLPAAERALAESTLKQTESSKPVIIPHRYLSLPLNHVLKLLYN